MQRDLLAPLWERLDSEPPVFLAVEIDNEFGGSQNYLIELGLLQEITSTTSAVCGECGNGRVETVRILGNDRSGSVRAYIACPECGPVPISPELLKRWVIHVPNLLQTAFAACGGVTSEDVVTDHLWHLGRLKLAGRFRNAYFARYVHDENRPAVAGALATRRTAVLFLPTEESVLKWGQATANPVVSLESILTLGPHGITFDHTPVESRFADAGLANPLKPRRPRKRAIRAAKIERLKMEVIQLLRDAREHAYATLNLNGTPELLPRPTQQELGKRCDLDEYEVTRCFQDESAQELNFYWMIALDLDQVMAFRGPVGGRPAT